MVRFGKIEDLEDVMIMLNLCKDDLNERGFHFWNDKYPTLETISEDLVTGNTIVCELDGKVIAFLVMCPNRLDKYEEYYRVHENYCYIARVMVHPEYRRRGHAQEILHYAETLGYDELRLRTRNTNVYSVNLYKKLGYTAMREETKDGVILIDCEKVLK